ncbi:MAG: hypothetical protein EOO75_17070 [Myxococcales bacterium]|nr:MAG: hypothetical protein EOO75_17070 [Myxococcales bacterium]
MSSEKQESSVLFSLKELMNLEEDRLRQEEQDRKRLVEDEDRRRREEEQAKMRSEQERLQQEEERRRQDDLRRREDETRLEGIRQAEIEKKRIEAERAAQLEAMSKQQEHARQLALIQQDQGKKKLRNTLIGVGVGSALLIGGLVVLGVNKSKENEAQQLAAQQELQRKNEEAEKAKKDAEEAQKRITQLMDDLRNAKDETTRAALAAKLTEAQNSLNKPAAGVGGPRPAGAKPGGDTGGPAKPAKACPPGDPLCGL